MVLNEEEKILRNIVIRMNSSVDENNKFLTRLKPWAGTLIILPVTVFYTLNMGKFTFIDYVNILIHEGGHGIFRIFGTYIHALGGTLMQIIIPALFIFYFISNRNRFGTQISFVYLGENLMNICVYAADARAHKLPLLGGNKVYHDWTYLLGEIGLLDYDIEVGYVIYGLGVLTFVVALVVPLFMKDYLNINLYLKT